MVEYSSHDWRKNTDDAIVVASDIGIQLEVNKVELDTQISISDLVGYSRYATRKLVPSKSQIVRDFIPPERHFCFNIYTHPSLSSKEVPPPEGFGSFCSEALWAE